jgi:hypothetical protein
MHQVGELGNTYGREVAGPHPHEFPVSGAYWRKFIFVLQVKVFLLQAFWVLIPEGPVEHSGLAV